MEYKQVAELTARKYYGGDLSADAGLEMVDFEKAVQSAYAFKVKLDYWNTYRLTGEREVNQAFLESFSNVAVAFDNNTDVFYSKLPQQVLDLPREAGITITAQKNQQNPFAPQTLGESFIFSSNPDDIITYHRDKLNVYYDNFDPDIKEVFMQYPPLFAEDIPDEFVTEIIDIVLTQFLKIKLIQEDKINDNNPNITGIGKQ